MRVKRALLVEDHCLIREALAVVLEEHTDLKKTVQAGSLLEAQQVLADLDTKVDLAIVDLDLPEGATIDLIEHLRKACIPVMAFTVDQSLDRRTWGLRAGADEVLTLANSGEHFIDTAVRLVSG